MNDMIYIWIGAVIILIVLFTNNFVMTWLDGLCCEKNGKKPKKPRIWKDL